MRIATFNLESLDDRAGAAPALADRLPVLRPQLERLAADVLCLQEVNAQRGAGRGRALAALDRLLDGTRYAGFERVHSVGCSGEPLDVHNLVILSRFPVRAHGQLRNDLVPAPDWRLLTADPPAAAPEPVRWDRPALHATLELPDGRILNVVNLHLRAPLASFVPGQKESAFAWSSISGWAEGFFLAAVKRAGQAFETRLLVERLFDADAAALIAVCGDCNADDREMPLRLLRAETGDTGNGRLAARSLIALEASVPEERRFTVLHAGRRVMLDHLLVSRPLLAGFREIEIHNEALADEVVGSANAIPSPESYHAPIVARFDLGRRRMFTAH